MSKTIHVAMRSPSTGNQWFEAWKGYTTFLTEEVAITEVRDMIRRFNNSTGDYLSDREAISFVLEDVPPRTD